MTAAALLGLAEFIAVVQDGLQRSYDFIEDVGEGARDGRPQGVLLTVSEVGLSIPVEWSVRTSAVDLRGIEADDGATTAYELEKLLLTMPMADPEIRRTIREEAYSAISRRRSGEPRPMPAEGTGDRRAEAPPFEAREGRPQKPALRPPPTLDIRFSDDSKNLIKRVYERGELREPEVAVTVLAEESLRANGSATGRLEIRFKPVLG